MKITEQDYQKLKSFIEPFKGKISEHREWIRANCQYKDLETYLRWSLLHRQKESLPFICDVLYKYLNDSHIDTALKQIMKELENTERAELEKEYLIQQGKIEFNG